MRKGRRLTLPDILNHIRPALPHILPERRSRKLPSDDDCRTGVPGDSDSEEGGGRVVLRANEKVSCEGLEEEREPEGTDERHGSVDARLLVEFV